MCSRASSGNSCKSKLNLVFGIEDFSKFLSFIHRNSSGSKETSTLVASENKEMSHLPGDKVTPAVVKDNFADLMSVLLQPSHLGTVIVNSEADESNPSIAEELELKAK